MTRFSKRRREIYFGLSNIDERGKEKSTAFPAFQRSNLAIYHGTAPWRKIVERPAQSTALHVRVGNVQLSEKSFSPFLLIFKRNIKNYRTFPTTLKKKNNRNTFIYILFGISQYYIWNIIIFLYNIVYISVSFQVIIYLLRC